MRILGIDTSSKLLSISLSEDDVITAEESHELGRSHSRLMIPKIKEMLERLNLSIKDVDAYAVGLGPGSFTGLRVGVSTIKGFVMGTGKPCAGVPSIDAMALEASSEIKDPKREKIVPVIDAKRGQLYGAVYQKTKNGVKKKNGYLLLPPEKLMKRAGPEALFLGDGIDIYGKTMKKLNKNAVFLSEKYWYPKAGNLIRLSLKKLKEKRKPDLGKLNPLYIYPKDCQVKK